MESHLFVHMYMYLLIAFNCYKLVVQCMWWNNYSSLRDVDTFQPPHIRCTCTQHFFFHCFHWTFSSRYSFSSGHEELIQTLTWDGTGSRLLSTDLVGVCKLWVMKVRLINAQSVLLFLADKDFSHFPDTVLIEGWSFQIVFKKFMYEQ